MNSSLVSCGKCQESLPAEVLNSPNLTQCPACGVAMRALVFPALFRPLLAGDVGERLMLEGEASCFYHPQKKAAVPCHRCGRFLCGLCDVELSGEHVCPACLESGKQKGKLRSLENRRVLYDDIAFTLAFWPLLPFFWFFSFITAPAAFVFALRFWNAPTSLLPRTKARMVAAIILSSLQILAWIGIVIVFIVGLKSRL